MVAGTMDQAGILPQAHIPGTMAPILDQPVPPLELQEPRHGPDRRWQTGNLVAHLLLARALLPPGSLDPDDLGHTGPIRQSEGIDPSMISFHL